MYGKILVPVDLSNANKAERAVKRPRRFSIKAARSC